MIKSLFNFRRLFLASAGLFLTACADDSGTQDLEQYIAEIRSAEASEIAPLPLILPTESYAYSAATEDNPFSISNVLPEKKILPKAAPLTRELSREREALESYPLDSLKMVGTLAQGGTLWAMVMAPDDTIHRVKKGNYIGTNLGEILQVDEGQIVVEETFESDEGVWEKRKVSVALPE